MGFGGRPRQEETVEERRRRRQRERQSGGGGGGGGEKNEPRKLKSPFFDPLVGEGQDPRSLPAYQRSQIFAHPRGRTNAEVEPLRNAPLYQRGMQWEPVNYTPAEIWELQQLLMDSGYADSLTAKVWDEKSANAFQRVLVAANTQGVPWEQIVQAGLESEEGYAAAKAEAERGPLQIGLANPEELGATVRAVAERGGGTEGFGVIGRGTTPGEEALFAADYQNQQRMIQTDEYNRGLEPGEFTEMPSDTVAAEEWLRKHRPHEVIATDAAERAKVWFDMLANSQWRLSKGG
jgi:hypothetical protein